MSEARTPARAGGPHPPAATPGSIRYFVLLYCAPARRQGLATLLALADEISAGAAQALEHEVAHLRLQWWQQEAQRLAAGQPQHPWLRALAADDASRAGLDLRPLVAAALNDLATHTVQGRPGTQLAQQRFVSAGVWLSGTASESSHSVLAELGLASQQLQAGDPAQAAAAARGLARQIAALPATLQPPLTPLLVWCQLALRHWRRAAVAASFRDPLRDTFAAWRCARRAARGRFFLHASPSDTIRSP